MNEQSETFVLSFPKPPHTISTSFRFSDTDWLVRLIPSLLSHQHIICVIQIHGSSCSAANIEVKYKQGKQGGICVWFADREWRSKSVTKSSIIELTMTRTVYNIATGALADDLTTIGDSAMYADISIIASDGSTIPAYKLFLMMRSSVFRRMFSTAMSESSTNTITIDDVEPAAVRSFVQFTYTDQLNPCCVSLCVQLYRMAHKYEVRGLKLLSLGQFYNAFDLRDSALHFISHHAATLATSAGFARRVNVYLTDYFSSTTASPSVNEWLVSIPTTIDNPTTTPSTATLSPAAALLSALAGTSPGINQYPHLNLAKQRDAGPLLFKCERCSAP